MKILFLPAYYYPEHVASSNLGDDLRKSLCDNGYEIVLYAPVPSRGVSNELRKEFSSKEKKNEKLFGGRMIVHRFSLYAEGKNPVFRALRYVLCWVKQFNRGLFAKNIDLIYLASTPPIQGLLGAFLQLFLFQELCSFYLMYFHFFIIIL